MGHYDHIIEAEKEIQEKRRLASSCPLVNGELYRLSNPYFKINWEKVENNRYKGRGSHGLVIDLRTESAFWITEVSLGSVSKYVNESKELLFKEIYEAVKQLLANPDVMMNVLFR
jgi:hypothetical protein